MTDQVPLPNDTSEESIYDLEQWVVWRLEERKGKPTKVPYMPVYGPEPKPTFASTVNPDTWTTYKVANVVAKRKGFDGVGFVFTKDDPYIGIDLDAKKDEKGNVIEPVIDPETHEMAPWAEKIVQQLDSYTEISQSGTGLHIIARGEIPERGKNRPADQVEIYTSGRYFAFTGNELPGMYRPITERQKEINALYAEYQEEEAPRATETTVQSDTVSQGASGSITTPSGSNQYPDLTTEEILHKIRSSKNAAEFEDLYAGNYQRYPSQSEADQALANKLAFYVGPDGHDKLDELFRSSGLMRSKWDKKHHADGRTYGQGTIDKAIADRDTFYTLPDQPDQSLTVGQFGQFDSSQSVEKPSKPSPRGQHYDVPAFPVEAMPEACQNLIEDASKALGCAKDFIATAMLSAIAGGIGATRSIMVKKGWTEHAGLFLAVVGDPGSMKSPAVKIALNPVYKLNKKYEGEFRKKLDDHKRELREYDLEKTEARKEGRAAAPPPEAPTMKSTIVVDTTVEAMSEVLVRNLRGLVVHRDELTGWLRSMDQYKAGGKGSDRSHWLSIWDNQDLVIHRKSNIDEPIIITTPLVSLIGGIQPAMLGELGGPMEDGLMERFLFSYPNIRTLKHNWYEIRDESTEKYAKLYHKLMSLQGGLADAQISPRPLHLTFEAKQRFGPILDEISAEAIQPGFPPRMQAAWSKMRGYLARLALVLAVCRFHTSEAEVEQVEVEDVENAYTLLKYFMAHARRVYGNINAASPEEAFAGALKSFLEEHGDTWTSTPTDLLGALREADVPDLPEKPEAITKKIKRVADHSTGLEVITGGKNSQGKRVVEVNLRKELPDPEDPSDLLPPRETVKTVKLSKDDQEPDKTAASGDAPPDLDSGQVESELSNRQEHDAEVLDSSPEPTTELSNNRQTETPIDKGNLTVGQFGQVANVKPEKGGTPVGERSFITGLVQEEGMCHHDQWPQNCKSCSKE